MPIPTHELWSPAARQNPTPIYARLRREGQLVRLPGPHDEKPIWLTLDHATAVEVLRDPRLAKDVRHLHPSLHARMSALLGSNGNDALLGPGMLNFDPPDHTRLRSLVSRAFTPKRIADLRVTIEAITARVLDSLRGRDTIDFLTEVADPIPIEVIAGMLGLPIADRPRFRNWADKAMLPPIPENEAARIEGAMVMRAYFDELFARRRAEPSDDLVSALLNVESEIDGRLSSEEVFGMVSLLLVAGFETTVNLLANGMLALQQHPEQLECLRETPGLIESAVEELLRFAGPVEFATGRFFVEDTELHGQRIPAGELVVAGLYAANRDPAQFPEPERFDLARTPNRHLGFGLGIHVCLGAPLARLEVQVALPMILERLPRLRLAVAPERVEWRSNLPLRGLRSLPMRLA
jgi:cytochrome P450